MKRSILTILLLAVAATTNAQLISSSSLVITKAKLPPVESGYEQSVDASYAMMMTGANNLEANISYIGGYRFNGHIFLGAGIGISIMDSVKESYETHSVVTGGNGDCLSCPLVNIPLYVHFKAYFLKSRVSPLFALSAGGRLSAKKEFGMETGENIRYGTMGLYVNPSVGVNYRVSEKNSLYFSVGLKGTTVPSVNAIELQTLTVKRKFAYGVDWHLGFTF